MVSIKALLLSGAGELAPLIVVIGLVWWAHWLLRRTPDAAWVATAIVSVVALLAALVVQGALLADDDPSNDLADVTYVSYLIVPLFGAALWRNTRDAMRLAQELATEKQGNAGAARRRYHELLATLRPAHGAQFDAVDLLVQEIADGDELTPLARRALPTLGLIGTVIGLAMAMADLGEALSAAVGGGGNSDGLMTAMADAMRGMGGAFVTTLLGAGYALLLMVLASRLQSVIRRLVQSVADKVEKERVQKELVDKERIESERLDREQAEKEQAEKGRLEAEQAAKPATPRPGRHNLNGK